MLDEDDAGIGSYARLALRLCMLMLLIVVLVTGHYVAQIYLPQSTTPDNIVNNDKIASVEIAMNAHHSFVVAGTINHQDVTFLVDTGASTVAIPLKYAKKLGLKLGGEVHLKTAAGKNVGYMTTIRHLAIGPIQLENVRAIAAPQAGSYSVLLGMTAIKQLEFTIRDDVLTLRQYKE